MSTLDELLEMGETDEGKARLRAMLAELVGWDNIRIDPTDSSWSGEPPQVYERIAFRLPLPNFCADLNAVHEIEHTHIKSWTRYEDVLSGVSKGELIKSGIDPCDAARIATIHATALQRTIALILTLQKP